MKTCAQCGIAIRRRKFCGQPCYGDYLKARGIKPPSRTGQKASAETRKRQSESIKAAVPRGEQHPSWNGDNVGMKALHEWVYKTLGRPQKCEHCGTTEGQLDWANKSQKYKRSVDDWIRLCRACHVKYDDIGARARDSRLRNGTASGWKWKRNDQPSQAT